MAGIVGNLALVVPLVLGVQLLAWLSFGKPLVGRHDAEHVLQTLSLLGPTPLFAAFTGVLLFASSLIAGWVENWFVCTGWTARSPGTRGWWAAWAKCARNAGRTGGAEHFGPERQHLAGPDAGPGAGAAGLLRARPGSAPRHAVDRAAWPRSARWAWTSFASPRSGGAWPPFR
jgi:hypothetical protein